RSREAHVPDAGLPTTLPLTGIEGVDGATCDRPGVVERLVGDHLLGESEHNGVGKRPDGGLAIAPQVPLRAGARLDGAAVAQETLARRQGSEAVALGERSDAGVQVLPAPGREC